MLNPNIETLNKLEIQIYHPSTIARMSASGGRRGNLTPKNNNWDTNRLELAAENLLTVTCISHADVRFVRQ